VKICLEHSKELILTLNYWPWEYTSDFELSIWEKLLIFIGEKDLQKLRRHNRYLEGLKGLFFHFLKGSFSGSNYSTFPLLLLLRSAEHRFSKREAWLFFSFHSKWKHLQKHVLCSLSPWIQRSAYKKRTYPLNILEIRLVPIQNQKIAVFNLKGELWSRKVYLCCLEFCFRKWLTWKKSIDGHLDLGEDLFLTNVHFLGSQFIKSIFLRLFLWLL